MNRSRGRASQHPLEAVLSCLVRQGASGDSYAQDISRPELFFDLSKACKPWHALERATGRVYVELRSSNLVKTGYDECSSEFRRQTMRYMPHKDYSCS